MSISSDTATENRVRVVIADASDDDRASIRRILERFDDVALAGEARDGGQLFDLLARTRPDVALVDLSLPLLDGPDEGVGRVAAAIPTIGLSRHGEQAHILRALREGVCGFLLKEVGRDELELAIRSAARGESFLCPSVARQVIEAYVDRMEDGHGTSDRLTARQRQVLQLVAEGRTTKDIARELGVSMKTVESHRAEIMRRLGVHHMASLVREAVRMGLFTPND